MMPAEAATIRETERRRILSIIDSRIAAWEQFQAQYPDHPEQELWFVLAELDALKEQIAHGSKTKKQADHSGG